MINWIIVFKTCGWKAFRDACKQVETLNCGAWIAFLFLTFSHFIFNELRDVKFSDQFVTCTTKMLVH